MDKIAMEYGDGLFELANDERIAEVLLAQTRILKSLLENEPAYISLITSKKLSKDEKEKLLSDAFEGRVHPYLYNFLRLMNDRGYFFCLPSCFARFEECCYRKNGLTKVVVKSAAEMDDDQKKRIKESIDAKTGLKSEITWLVDPTLVAGLRVEADGILLENSAKSRFEDLKRHLSAAVTTNI